MRKIIQIIAFLVLVAFYTATGQGVRGGHLENIVLGEAITAPAMIYLDPTGGKAFKAVATDAGKAAQAVLLVSGAADDQRQAHWGPCVIEWPTSLTPGEKYYLTDTDGDVATTPGTNEQFIGDVTANGLFSVNIAPFAAAGGGGGSDGNGIYDGSGTVPDATKVQLDGYTSPFEILYTSSSPPTPGNPAISIDSDGGILNFYDNSGTNLQLNGGFYIYATGGSDGIGLDANGQISRSGAVHYAKYDLTDYTSDIIADDNAITSVKSVKRIALEGPNNMTTTQRDALTPSSGWTIYNTTLNKIQTYDGSAWQSHW